MSDSYKDKCEKPIPIGKQKFAYQCENVVLSPINGSINIRGYKPFSAGKEPYPNQEAGLIEHYDLKISQFTGNAIEVILTKRYKDGSEETYLTNVSFAELVNRVFENYPANIWKHEPPINQYQP